MKKIIHIETPEWWMPLAEHLDFNIAVSIGIVSLLTIIYTALGGLKAVVVTESIQTVLLLLGAAAVTVFGLLELANRDTTSLDGSSSSLPVQQERAMRAGSCNNCSTRPRSSPRSTCCNEKDRLAEAHRQLHTCCVARTTRHRIPPPPC